MTHRGIGGGRGLLPGPPEVSKIYGYRVAILGDANANPPEILQWCNTIRLLRPMAVWVLADDRPLTRTLAELFREREEIYCLWRHVARLKRMDRIDLVLLPYTNHRGSLLGHYWAIARDIPFVIAPCAPAPHSG